jgi:hypothetical protein
MQTFTERVNAVLPIDQPDGILLALVQGHPDKVCGISCPAGQSLSHFLQCVPNALLAQIGKTKITATTSQKLTEATSAWTVKTTLTEIGHPGDAARVDAASATAPAPGPKPRRVAEKHWQPPSIKRERSWASVLFKFSFN